MKLHYPSGTPVRIGDRVWFNEGMAVGFVESFIAAEGHDGPMVIVDLFPTESSLSSLVGLPYASFNDEGVDVLSGPESAEIDTILSQTAHSKKVREDHCAVFRTNDGPNRFPFVIVVFSPSKSIEGCYKILSASMKDGIDMVAIPRTVLPPFAFPVHGGGPRSL